MKELNKEQSLLVNELNNNILLIASAGTGKTDTLAIRISNIMKSGRSEAKEILCITFTNKACKEMRERIEVIVGKEAKDINVKTFHSFCLQIIKEQAKKKTDIFTDFTILDEDDCKELLKQFNNWNFPIDSVYRFVTIVKESRIKFNFFTEDHKEDYRKTIDNLFKYMEKNIDDICTVKKVLNRSMKDSFRRFGDVLLQKYNAELKINHMLDFSDLIMEVKLLFDDQKIVESYANRYKYINIDEVQDTSITEYNIIEKIFSNNNILLCGDIFQTIYGWRGSQPNLIENAFMKYNPQIIKYYKNYRATKNLTNASLKYLENVFDSEYKKMYSNPIESHSVVEGDKILCHGDSERAEEAYWIGSNMDKLFKSSDNPGKACILTRDNSLNVELSKYLNKYNSGENYEFILVDQYKFFRRQEIKDIIAFLKLIVNNNDDISLKRILRRFPTGVGDVTIDKIQSNDYKNIGIKLTDFIKPEINGEYFSTLIEAYNNKEPIIVFDVESTGVDVTEDEIIQIAAIKIDEYGEIIETFERFIKPNRSVGNSASVHGFTDEYLNEHGQKKESVFKEFLDFSNDALIVGHNVQYDINILSSQLKRCGMGEPRFKGVYDTLDIFRRFYPNLPNHKLETLSKIFPIKHEPSHNALDDVKATSYLLVHAIEEKLIPTAATRFGYMTKDLKKFKEISDSINILMQKSANMRPYEIIDYIVNNFSLHNAYAVEEREGKMDRIDNFKQFLKMFDNKDKNNRDSLIEVVNLTALSNGELEELMIERTGKVRIPIITVHQAKGLEFDYVFLAGLEENRFPTFRAVKSGDLKEEARTFYVAITRAKKKLFISYSKRNNYGYETYPSRFINEISNEFLLKV